MLSQAEREKIYLTAVMQWVTERDFRRDMYHHDAFMTELRDYQQKVADCVQVKLSRA